MIEVTQTVVGTNITNENIQDLPTQGRQQYALLQLIPGTIPTLGPGALEGSQYSANGRDPGSNLFLVDGAYNVDDRTLSGSGSQTRMTIDTTAEYQVLVHEYGAEYGGVLGARRERNQQEWDECISRRGGVLLSRQQPGRHQLFPEAGWPEKPRQRREDVVGTSWRADYQEQALLFCQCRAPANP